MKSQGKKDVLKSAKMTCRDSYLNSRDSRARATSVIFVSHLLGIWLNYKAMAVVRMAVVRTASLILLIP